jgi:putative Mg2+ transporter-C (MgtC) family protein
MVAIYPWLGDLNHVEGLGRESVGLICLAASVVCGGFIGVERERREKPAGLRTVILITVGSTIFTLVSLMLGEKKATADPARLASQIVPGIGFLGAGAIIYARGAVLGMTTGATIWACAAIGVTIGSGFVAAGVAFTMIVFLTLTVLQRFEHFLDGRCRLAAFAVSFRPARGKTWVHLQSIFDRFGIPEQRVARRSGSPADDEQVVEITVCTSHRSHRAVLKEIADCAEVAAIEASARTCAVV